MNPGTEIAPTLSAAIEIEFNKPLLLVQLDFVKACLPHLTPNQAGRIAALPLDAKVARIAELKAARTARCAS